VQRLVGRLQEQAVLGKILKGNEPEFLALYGRRRVGKTFLIREFFHVTISGKSNPVDPRHKTSMPFVSLRTVC